MDLAGRIEERNQIQGNRRRGGEFGESRVRAQQHKPRSVWQQGKCELISTYGLPSTSGPAKSWSKPTESQGSVNLNRPCTSRGSKTTIGPRRLTEAELQERRAKGLCFRCDERWSAGHRCKHKELSVLMVAEEEVDGESDKGEEADIEEAVEVSLCSVVGLTNQKTMKLRGEIQGCEVVVMIDPGATHNFLSLRVIEEEKVAVREGGEFEVSLGNGESVRGLGVCKGVRVKLDGGITLMEEF